MAKIKKPTGHNYNPLKHKPRGITPGAFEKVYWPYMPILLVVLVGLGLALQPGSWGRVFNSNGKVLAYATEMNRSSLLNETNQLRVKDNLADLSMNAKLTRAAQAKAEDMVKHDYWSHNAPDGKTPWAFVRASDYSYRKLGENLAAGFGDSDSVVRAWYASQSHRQNLLDSKYSEVGFGVANISDFKAAGGGPMTVVAAMYGQPGGTASTAGPLETSNPPATTESSTAGQSLAAKTSRAELAFAKTPFGSVATSLVLITLLGAVGFWAGRHLMAVRRAWVKSERFVIRHPAMDLFLLGIVVLSLILSQTAGLIQ